MMGFTQSRVMAVGLAISVCMIAAPVLAQAGALPEETIPLRTMDTAPPLQVDAASQEIPQGRLVRITFLTPLDANTSRLGDPFMVELSEDLMENDRLLLPKGTVVRGRIDEIQHTGLFGKGGLIRLNFDHAVMPSGELEPMNLRLNATSDKVTQERVLYTDPGLGAKLDTSLDKGVDQFRELRDKGIEAGRQRGGGINMLLTVPTTTVAGVVAGTAVTTFNAAKAVFGHGTNVVIQPGEQMEVDFAHAIHLTSQ